MKRYFVGLDVSKDETAVCLRDDRGDIVTSFKTPTDPDVLLRALSKDLAQSVCVVLETGRMSNWLYDESSRRGFPMVCIDARQAHAVLSQMHNSEAVQAHDPVDHTSVERMRMMLPCFPNWHEQGFTKRWRSKAAWPKNVAPFCVPEKGRGSSQCGHVCGDDRHTGTLQALKICRSLYRSDIQRLPIWRY